ncbi:aspartate/glutamate racemase family protein [Planctomonas psychrotolerans]|uniref:aspartate/glutamate racemase family protein n=1 Tax=Planctomonas psychrotolerans TaxID=2528712 RepID=UPI0012392DF1|nr:aspartate/glutamate racemase family protein [Planctomonas psychrotolerans]
MTRVGLVHTVPGLVGDFSARLTAANPDLDMAHVADPSLLSRAIAAGVTPDVLADVERYVRTLAESGCQAVLVTCSSIGGAVDDVAAGMDIPVLRVDRPMAREAVRLAAGGSGHVVVLATLEATLAPTTALIRAEAGDGAVPVPVPLPVPVPVPADAGAADAGAAAHRIEVSSEVLPGAFAARARGDDETHDTAVRDACARWATSADVIVLAQASMAQALGEEGYGIPVLTSPASGAEALLAAVAP